MNEKVYLKEFQYFDGEAFIVFNMLELKKDKVIVAVSNRGRITVYEYDLYEDENGKYFEYGSTYARIAIKDFEFIDDEDEVISIEICNLRKETVKYPYDVRVDRASILGNPYIMKNESQRDEVCDKYEAYFDMQMKSNMRFRNTVIDLVNTYKQYGKLRLFCWCAPKRCHAEYIKQAIERILEKGV